MRFILGLICVCVLCACATFASHEGADAREVRAATAAWVAAYNSRDPGRLAALYDAEAALWGTVSASHRKGIAAVADYFKDAAKRPEARVTIVEQNARSFGTFAVSSGAYTFTDVRDGKNINNPARSPSRIANAATSG